MVILVLVYLYIEPIFLYTLKRKPERTENITAEAQGITDESENCADTEETFTAVSGEDNRKINSLSKRELEVADLIAVGYSNADIAKMLFISPHTVNDHTKKIYRKLDVHSRFELTALINKMSR